ncbi:MAG: CooT family nickel-binding protein [Oscillospiraceae bacterium]|jgi:predicted RNA-binding protein|nr:CooT family nickel-binding protein [Oscillospiraceae bacterium]
MCLSTAYDIGGGTEKLIADRVTGISVEEGAVRLTTLLGTQTLVEGRLKSVDLNRNVILIEAKQ